MGQDVRCTAFERSLSLTRNTGTIDRVRRIVIAVGPIVAALATGALATGAGAIGGLHGAMTAEAILAPAALAPAALATAALATATLAATFRVGAGPRHAVGGIRTRGR